METRNFLEKVMSGEELTVKEKIELARDLVAENVADILQREMVIANKSGTKTKITLKARDCRDSDEDIRKYLAIMGAKNIKVTSDFPVGYAGESYEGTTTIEFDY